jgi:hypothetical protein
MQKFFFVLLCIVFNVTTCTALTHTDTIKRTRYERLLLVDSLKFKLPAIKNHRIFNLEYLAGKIIDAAIHRIIDILGQSAELNIKSLQKYIYVLLPQKDIAAQNIIFSYAIADFNEQIKRDNIRMGGIGAIANLPIDEKKDLILLELEELNERYSPIITALKKLKPETPLPPKLTLKAIEQFDALKF